MNGIKFLYDEKVYKASCKVFNINRIYIKMTRNRLYQVVGRKAPTKVNYY